MIVLALAVPLMACQSSARDDGPARALDELCGSLASETRGAAAGYQKVAAMGLTDLEHASANLRQENGLIYGLTSSERSIGANALAMGLRACIMARASSGSAEAGEQRKERMRTSTQRFLLAADAKAVSDAMSEIAALAAELATPRP